MLRYKLSGSLSAQGALTETLTAGRHIPHQKKEGEGDKRKRVDFTIPALCVRGDTPCLPGQFVRLWHLCEFLILLTVENRVTKVLKLGHTLTSSLKRIFTNSNV